MPGYDDYVDEGGGLLMDFAGPVADAYFVDGKYGTQLEIHVALDHPEDHPNIAFGIVKNFFGCGPGWSVIKNGAEVQHASGADKKFNGNTDMGRLMNQIKVADSDGSLLANGTPYQAAFWKAINAQWGPIEWGTNEFTNDAGEVVPAKTKKKAMPVHLVGAASTNGQAPAGFDLASLQLSDEIMAGLSAAASASKSYSDFLPKAVSVPGLPSTPAWGQISNTETGPRILKALQPF